jgi:CheY-like chemotaxis protein/DNA-binding XRE family transcriptional regulator
MQRSQSLQEKFGSLVRTRRNELGVSQETLAERASLHRSYVADIERGARNPSLSSIERLAHALQTSLSSLLSPLNGHVEHAVGARRDPSSGAVDMLLVEDNPADVQLALRAFERAGLLNRVTVARTGTEALACLSGAALEHPWLVLLDLELPRMGGLEVLRRMRGDERLREVPVVVLTGSRADADMAECRRLGVQAYITKPLDFQRLAEVTPQLRFSWLLTQHA